MPLLSDGDPIGAITVTQLEARPFTDTQIALLQTFAGQAVIAIENVRLFKELEARNRDLMESLEQQTATGEILRVIASSPTDLQPVMDAVAETPPACAGRSTSSIFRLEGEHLRVMALHGSLRPSLGGWTMPLPVGARRTVPDCRRSAHDPPRGHPGGGGGVPGNGGPGGRRVHDSDNGWNTAAA